MLNTAKGLFKNGIIKPEEDFNGKLQENDKVLIIYEKNKSTPNEIESFKKSFLSLRGVLKMKTGSVDLQHNILTKWM